MTLALFYEDARGCARGTNKAVGHGAALSVRVGVSLNGGDYNRTFRVYTRACTRNPQNRNAVKVKEEKYLLQALLPRRGRVKDRRSGRIKYFLRTKFSVFYIFLARAMLNRGSTRNDETQTRFTHHSLFFFIVFYFLFLFLHPVSRCCEPYSSFETAL